MFIGITPVRLSFAGGGTDMPEYFDEYGGNVISSTISKYTYSIFHPRYDSKFQAFSPDFEKHYKPTKFSEIKIESGSEIVLAAVKYLKFKTGVNIIVGSDVPGGSGLGASSALTVNLVHAITKLKNQKLSKSEEAEMAFHIGRNLLKMPIGKQDEYVAAFGGLNFLKFEKNKVNVKKVPISTSSFLELEKNLLLFFIGDTRDSSKILSEQIKRIKKRDKQIIESLNHVKNFAQDMYKSFVKNDITKVGDLLNEGWIRKKKFVKGVSNSKIDKIYEIAINSGATGGKLTGAGGGGHMLFYCEKRKQKKVIDRLTKLKLKHIEFNFEKKGSRTIDVNKII